MGNHPASINLFKNKEIPFFDRFIDWALNIGRLIIIATEIIAMTAFIYRFSLDERLSQLNSSIKQKQTLISILKKDENKYRNLQDRITLVSEFSDVGNKPYKIFQDVVSFTPYDIKFSKFSLSNENLHIDLSTTSTNSLNELVNSLKNYSPIKLVSIDNIENKPSIGLIVAITALLK